MLAKQSQIITQFTRIYRLLHSYKILHSDPFIPVPFRNTIFWLFFLLQQCSLLSLSPAKSLLHFSLSKQSLREGQSDQTQCFHFSSCLEFLSPSVFPVPGPKGLWHCPVQPLLLSNLQQELPHLSLPFMCHSPHQSWCPPLYLLQSGNVFLILRSPELDPGLQVWSHWEGIEMKNHSPGCWEDYFSKTNDPLTKSSHIIPTDPAVQTVLVLALLPSVHCCFSTL